MHSEEMAATDVTSSRNTFLELSEVLLESNNRDQEYKAACSKLYDWFCTISNTGNSFDNNHTYLNSGQALSVHEAGECLLDYKRTVSFLQSIRCALEDISNSSSDTPIRVLYAGTGPFGTLLLPVLHLFTDNIQITIIDIHHESIENLRSIIELLGYQEYFTEYIVDDASAIDLADHNKFDLIISETMNQALIKEPQVSIMENLIPSLSIDGIFIPQEINISVACSRYTKEPNLTQNRNEYVLRNNVASESNKIIELERLPALNQKTIPKFFSSKKSNYKTKWQKLPKEHEECPDICLFTEIVIYKSIKLSKADSLITNPYCLASIPNFADKSYIKLAYLLKDNSWTYELK